MVDSGIQFGSGCIVLVKQVGVGIQPRTGPHGITGWIPLKRQGWVCIFTAFNLEFFHGNLVTIACGVIPINFKSEILSTFLAIIPRIIIPPGRKPAIPFLVISVFCIYQFPTAPGIENGFVSCVEICVCRCISHLRLTKGGTKRAKEQEPPPQGFCRLKTGGGQ